jgi:hypothetical protein
MIEKYLKKPTNKKVKPHYKLTINYMIGDADGKTREIVKLSEDNPYIERFCTLLMKLKPLPSTWGIVFGSDSLSKFVKDGQITEDDAKFLSATMFDDDDDDEFGKYDIENDKFLNEFYNCISGETEYSFLVFETLDLKYYDENNVEYLTRFI